MNLGKTSYFPRFSGDTRSDEVEDAQRFKTWKSNLGILGIPYMDVLRYALYNMYCTQLGRKCSI